jgi:hypothetical protein
MESTTYQCEAGHTSSRTHTNYITKKLECGHAHCNYKIASMRVRKGTAILFCAIDEEGKPAIKLEMLGAGGGGGK